MKDCKLKIGDIILSNSHQKFPKLIAKWTDGKWTHASVYVGLFRGEKMVIESAIGGVQFSSLRKYKGRDICVMRSELDSEDINDVIEAAKEDIGKGFDYMGLFGYALSDIIFVLTKKRKKYENAEKYFCSELIKHHFEHSGSLDLSWKPSCNTSPMDLYYSESLKEIYTGRCI
jgi:uncharacterized protein YycO